MGDSTITVSHLIQFDIAIPLRRALLSPRQTRGYLPLPERLENPCRTLPAVLSALGRSLAHEVGATGCGERPGVVETKIAAQAAAKAAKMRKGDCLRGYGLAAATLHQALDDGGKEFSGRGFN